ncbi:uncharacterized protein LOC124361388 [Homalodisca vitripennis]|uniref:uncharacterized protein LOC124361388 n=1 Tax=Homalodisca vitripennis TaxID=197043 RepID=UPI001EEAF212|nr:uncharacterized protein LOC124361388 [Homalodisca vitripennis]
MEELGDHQLRITKNCNISTGVVDLLSAQDENYIKGGILSNPKLSWVSCGSRITTINNDDGSKRTGWTFGWGLSDPSYKIVCVEELPMGSFASPILVVGCESELNGSCLCFYHSGSSRVLKAIHFNDKIAALGMVSKTDAREERLSGLLKFWNGIIAVGTNSGKVYLLDVWWKSFQKYLIYFQIAALGMVSKTDAREERLSGLLKFWNGIIAVGTNSGKVYLLDVWWKSFQKYLIYFQIAALGMVSKTDAREERLSGLLKFWNGIIAVGTNSGKVYLLDVWWKSFQKYLIYFQIAALGMVSKTDAREERLSGLLKFWNGIIADGTNSGKV